MWLRKKELLKSRSFPKQTDSFTHCLEFRLLVRQGNILKKDWNFLYNYSRLFGFLITLSPNGPFASNSFFRPKTISRVAIIKTKSAAIVFFFSSPRSFFFSFPFSVFVTVIFELLGLKKLAFWRLLTQMTANFVFKLNRLDIYNIICIYSCPTLDPTF